MEKFVVIGADIGAEIRQKARIKNMRKVVMYCDRCKKEFEKWNYTYGKPELLGVAEFVYDDGDPYLDEHKDLCESCYTELENWWNAPYRAESEEV